MVSVGDWFFYRYWTIVAYNIVKYNVFSTAGSGPNIFGTEPWHFYLQNLLLNFNLWFLLALAALPLSLLNYLSSSPSRSELRQMPAGPLRALLFQTPFYLWLLLLSAQPHKEERFMYPVYPFLALNAAISAHILLAYLGSRTHASLFGRCLSYLPAKLRLTLAALPLLLAIDFSLLRTVGLITAYGAPLQIYAPLSDPTIALAGTSVCLAKEWHRFPSSFFLPGRTLRAKFAPSNFDGLLPAEFHEGRGAGFGFFAGAYLEPAGMNGENRAFAGHVLDDVRRCDFLIDSRFPSVAPTEREPDYAADGERWEKIVCKPYLDAWATSLLGRLVWVPDWKGLPEGWRRRWGEYCLLRRRIG